MLDVNTFKTINEDFGHKKGDEVLSHENSNEPKYRIMESEKTTLIQKDDLNRVILILIFPSILSLPT